MSIKPKRVRRKRRRQVSWLQNLQVRSGLVISIFVVLGFGVGLFAFSTVRKGWSRWHKASLLTTASDRLAHDQFAEAETMARKALAIDANSLVAARILAESTEKQNRAETVAWRAQIARLDPGLDSQLNLASAALRFGQLDVARDALARVTPDDHDKAPYHVVAGWLSRAQGNIADEERHFAAAVAQEPKNDLYQFNLAVLQIQSPDPAKNTAARNQLERLSKVAQFRTESIRALLDHALRQNQTDAANELAQALQMSPGGHLQRLPSLPRSLPETQPEEIRRPPRQSETSRRPRQPRPRAVAQLDEQKRPRGDGLEMERQTPGRPNE